MRYLDLRGTASGKEALVARGNAAHQIDSVIDRPFELVEQVRGGAAQDDGRDARVAGADHDGLRAAELFAVDIFRVADLLWERLAKSHESCGI